jgi:hypothetical protein
MNAFLPSFPIERMSLRQLEHIATSPSRLLRQFQQDLSSNVISPLATRILQARPPKGVAVSTTHEWWGERDITSMHLMPGGRFLVFSTREYLQLWDLGFNQDSIISPYPLASLPISGEVQEGLAVMFTGKAIVAWLQSTVNNK